MQAMANPWDERAAEYAEWIAGREREGVEGDAILAALLELLGDLRGRVVLDAACGNGFLARIFAGRGAP